MLLGLKYKFWYLVSHYRYRRMKKCIKKQMKYMKNLSVFRYFGRRFIHHAKKFEKIQVKLDTLKETLTNKYPDLAD